MIRLFSVIGLFVFSTSALAAVPIYLGDLKGTLLSGVSGRETLAFIAGTTTACSTLELVGQTRSRCQLIDAKATVLKEGSAQATEFTFTHAVLYAQDGAAGIKYTFDLFGTWKDTSVQPPLTSDARFLLTAERKNGVESYQGSLSLQDFGVTEGVVAYPSTKR